MTRHVSLKVSPAEDVPLSPSSPLPSVAGEEDLLRQFPMVWREDYSVGVPVLDRDHQRLLQLLNALAEAARGPCHCAAVSPALTSLRRYVEVHFEREERLLNMAQSPAFTEHLAQHRDFEQTVLDLEAHYAASADRVTLMSVLRFVRDWLIDHILHVDQGYRPFSDGVPVPSADHDLAVEFFTLPASTKDCQC